MFSLILWIFVLILWIGVLIIRTRPSIKNASGNRFHILLAIVFIILAVVLGLIYFIATPFGNGTDEVSHFLRVFKLSQKYTSLSFEEDNIKQLIVPLLAGAKICEQTTGQGLSKVVEEKYKSVKKAMDSRFVDLVEKRSNLKRLSLGDRGM